MKIMVTGYSGSGKSTTAADPKTATSFPPFTWTPFSFCRDGRFGPRRGSSASSRPFSTSIPMVG